MLAGAWLRLYDLAAMEFKGDEQEGLTLAMRLLSDPIHRRPPAGHAGPAFPQTVGARVVALARASGQLVPPKPLAKADSSLTCGPLPIEVSWIVNSTDPSHPEIPPALRLCDNWIERNGRLVYQ